MSTETEIIDLPAHIPISARRTTCAGKNDKLGWVDGFSTTIDGVTVGVRCNDAALLTRLRGLLPAWHQPSSERAVDVLLSFLVGRQSQHAGVRHYHLVYLHWNRVARTMELDEALQAFQDTVLPEVAARAREPLYLQGNVVQIDGKPLLVVGDPGATEPVVEALAQQGRRLMPPGQQYVAVTESTQIRTSGGEVFTPKIMLLVDPASRRRLKPEAVTAGASVLHLMRHAPSFVSKPQDSLPILTRLAAGVQSYQGAYQKPETALALARRRPRSR